MVRLTNRLNLPQPLVDAVAADPYSKGDADISVTSMIGPARIRRLAIDHDDELEEDAAERIWSLLGQIAHGILERADREAWTEERLFITRHGWRISGKFDRVVLIRELLMDWKLSSVRTVKDGLKPEWLAQNNLYTLMLREHGHRVTHAQTVVILRDWQKSAARHSPDYPQVPVVVLDAPIWSPERAEAYIMERLMAHGMAQEVLPDCTSEERWERPGTWAVTKVGNTRATSLHDTEEEAQAAVATLERSPKNRVAGYEIELREPVQVRCTDWCQVASVCDQWKQLNRGPLGLPKSVRWPLRDSPEGLKAAPA